MDNPRAATQIERFQLDAQCERVADRNRDQLQFDQHLRPALVELDQKLFNLGVLRDRRDHDQRVRGLVHGQLEVLALDVKRPGGFAASRAARHGQSETRETGRATAAPNSEAKPIGLRTCNARRCGGGSWLGARHRTVAQQTAQRLEHLGRPAVLQLVEPHGLLHLGWRSVKLVDERLDLGVPGFGGGYVQRVALGVDVHAQRGRRLARRHAQNGTDQRLHTRRRDVLGRVATTIRGRGR